MQWLGDESLFLFLALVALGLAGFTRYRMIRRRRPAVARAGALRAGDHHRRRVGAARSAHRPGCRRLRIASDAGPPGLRLHHRRRRLGRLRARQPADGRPGDHACCCSRPAAADHAWNWKIHMPAAFAYPLADDKVNWHYQTEPEPYHGRPRACIARAAGCSAAPPRSTAWSISAAMPATMTAGPQAGARGWSYADVLPYFKRAETRDRGARRLSRRRRAAPCQRRARAAAAVPGLHRGRPPGGLSADRGHQRLPAGRPRADGHDDLQGPALERRQRLSPAGA